MQLYHGIFYFEFSFFHFAVLFLTNSAARFAIVHVAFDTCIGDLQMTILCVIQGGRNA